MSEYMVDIATIPGESELEGYVDKIECISMHHAIELPIVADASVRTEGTSWHGAIELAHSIDKATPLLRHAAAAGTNLGEVTITRLRMVGGAIQVAETITLQDAYVLRVDTDTPLDPEAAEPAEQPLESFSLAYGGIKWDATHYVDGARKGVVAGAWSTRSASIG